VALVFCLQIIQEMKRLNTPGNDSEAINL
jgi:hypothetical protein